MQYVRVGLIALLMVTTSVQPVAALETVPTTEPLVDGPFLLTAYSFQGHSLRYAQITNTSGSVASLDGWKLQTSWSEGFWQSTEFTGQVEPSKKVTVASDAVLPSATFLFTAGETASEPRTDEIRVVAPTGSGYLDSVVVVSIKDSGSSMTPRETTTTPETFYFSRNRSSSTGNYLSSFSALATEPSSLESDPLYSPLQVSPLQIVEVYPRAEDCSPLTIGTLCNDYVKVFNATDQPVDLSLFRIRTGTISQSSTASNTAYPNGLLGSGEFEAIPISVNDSSTYVWIEDRYGSVIYAESTVEVPSSSSRQGDAWSYNAYSGQWQWNSYPSPGNEPNTFGDAAISNACEGLKLSEIGANYSPQFIEVYNASPRSIEIGGCQLQTNRSQTVSYKFEKGAKLSSGAYLAVPIEPTSLSLTKTTTGTVYILSSDGTTEVDARSYENLDEDTSFALVGGRWEQTFRVTPGSENQYQAYPPCETGYTRNELTGRCNKITPMNTLVACTAGQFRNPETNRCRSLTNATRALSTCQAGQYRNPETNRCKSLATDASSLKPCNQGYERNADTYRCRKVLGASTAIPSAAFPVEPIADTTKAFAAWWALGGVIMLGLAYAGWEWRYEIRQFIKRITPIHTS